MESKFALLGVGFALGVGCDLPPGDGSSKPGAYDTADTVDTPDDDVDDDGYDWGNGTIDCDDLDEAVHPGANERANGVDDDCDGEVDEGTNFGDDDGDGYSERDGDCDDDDRSIHPGATEGADGEDDDCDGVVDERTAVYDDDGDGYSERDGDCNDVARSVHPGATETANSRDDDCDGLVDEGTGATDADGDGWTVSEGDCDDSDRTVYPGATEPADGVDHDCDGDVTPAGPTWCGLSIACPTTLSDIGMSGVYSREYSDFTWQDNAACGIATAGPYFINAPTSLRSMTATVDSDAGQGVLGYLKVGATVMRDSVVGTNLLNLATWDDANTAVLPSGTGVAVGNGCTVLIPSAARSQVGRPGRLWLTSRRDTSLNTRIQFNFITVGATSIASSDLSSVAYYIDAYLGNAGMEVLSTTNYIFAAGDSTPTDSAAALMPIRAVRVAGDVRAVNVFFIEEFDGRPDLLGKAGGLPGPIGITETGTSGVVVQVSAFRSSGVFTSWGLRYIGNTIAHEVGHQLGLFHTSEAAGTVHDWLSDTPACTSSRDTNRDGRLSAEECVGYGADNIMFWAGADLDLYLYDWSATQSSTLISSPVSQP